MMKKIFFITLVSVFAFLSCEDTDLDSYDFSNSLPNYVQFKSVKALSVEPGAKASFSIVTKSSFFKDAEIVVKMEGEGLNATNTVTLPRMKTSVDGEFVIPETTPVGTDFEISLVSAKVDGSDIRLGRIDNTDTIIKGKVTEAKE